LYSGEIERLIATRNVTGITTNPTIFAKAVASTGVYDEQLAELRAAGGDAATAIVDLTTRDVAHACELFLPVFESTGGVDGRVSIEVSPDVAHDAAATLDQSLFLRRAVNRPNAYIKIPATRAGVTAITEATALGMSINVTLIFGLDRYEQVLDAYLTGLERADAAGIDIRGIHSVASFFVSRVDTEVNHRLERIGTPQAMALRSKLGIANARLAYELFERTFASQRAQALLARGANRQRPLWASTGVKDATLPDTLYVVELVAPDVVNTMPKMTLEAVADHAVIRQNSIAGNFDVSRWVLNSIAEIGISYDDVTATLEREGIEKFTASWNELLRSVSRVLEPAHR
jgi:transaldolase